MSMLPRLKLLVSMASLCSVSVSFAATMTNVEISQAKDHIAAELKTDQAACASLNGNQKDICKEQAKGKEKIARAELEMQRTGKPADARKLAEVKADAAFEVAKEMCDDKAGNAKDVCRSEAKAVHVKAMADAKLSGKVADARADAAESKREANYKVAVEKCDSLAGDAKAACLTAARTQYKP